MDIELDSVDGDDMEEATPLTALPPSFFQRILQQLNTLIANNASNEMTSSPSKAANTNNNDNISFLSRTSFFRAPSLSLFARPNAGTAPATVLTSSASTAPVTNAAASQNDTAMSLQSNSSRTSVLQQMTPMEEEVAIKVLGLRKHQVQRSHGQTVLSSPGNKASNDMNDLQRSSSVSHHRISLTRESMANVESDFHDSDEHDVEGNFRGHKILSDDTNNTNNTASKTNNGGGFGGLMGRETIMVVSELSSYRFATIFMFYTVF